MKKFITEVRFLWCLKFTKLFLSLIMLSGFTIVYYISGEMEAEIFDSIRINQFYLIYLSIIVLSVPMFIGNVMDEIKIPYLNYVLTKINKKNYLFVMKYLSYCTLLLITINIVILLSNAVFLIAAKQVSWIHTIKFLVIMDLTLCFVIAIVFYMYAVFGKTTYVSIIMFFSYYASVVINNNFFSFILPINSFDYLLNYKFGLFFLSRFIFFLIGLPVILWANYLLNNSNHNSPRGAYFKSAKTRR